MRYWRIVVIDDQAKEWTEHIRETILMKPTELYRSLGMEYCASNLVESDPWLKDSSEIHEGFPCFMGSVTDTWKAINGWKEAGLSPDIMFIDIQLTEAVDRDQKNEAYFERMKQDIVDGISLKNDELVIRVSQLFPRSIDETTEWNTFGIFNKGGLFIWAHARNNFGTDVPLHIYTHSPHQQIDSLAFQYGAGLSVIQGKELTPKSSFLWIDLLEDSILNIFRNGRVLASSVLDSLVKYRDACQVNVANAQRNFISSELEGSDKGWTMGSFFSHRLPLLLSTVPDQREMAISNLEVFINRIDFGRAFSNWIGSSHFPALAHADSDNQSHRIRMGVANNKHISDLLAKNEKDILRLVIDEYSNHIENAPFRGLQAAESFVQLSAQNMVNLKRCVYAPGLQKTQFEVFRSVMKVMRMRGAVGIHQQLFKAMECFSVRRIDAKLFADPPCEDKSGRAIELSFEKISKTAESKVEENIFGVKQLPVAYLPGKFDDKTELNMFGMAVREICRTMIGTGYDGQQAPLPFEFRIGFDARRWQFVVTITQLLGTAIVDTELTRPNMLSGTGGLGTEVKFVRGWIGVEILSQGVCRNPFGDDFFRKSCTGAVSYVLRVSCATKE